MSLLGELLMILRDLIHLAFNIYIFIVVARALVSWVNPDPYNPIVRFLHSATEPVLYRIRRLIPARMGGFDFSPIILLLGLSIAERIVVRLLEAMARGL